MSEIELRYDEIEMKIDEGYSALIKIIQCNCEQCVINKDRDFKFLLNYLNKVIY